MTNIFSELKNMNHQFSNAPSTALLRRLDIFLHFETCVLENSQKGGVSPKSGAQLDFLPHIYEARSQVEALISDVLMLFEDLRAHMFQSVKT